LLFGGIIAAKFRASGAFAFAAAMAALGLHSGFADVGIVCPTQSEFRWPISFGMTDRTLLSFALIAVLNAVYQHIHAHRLPATVLRDLGASA
jgi:hypothetical protein